MDDCRQTENMCNADSGKNAVLSHDEKNWGMFCHVAALAGFVVPFGNIIGPLVIWLIKKDLYGFVDYNAKQALNFQITMIIALIVSALLCLVLIGFFLMIGIAIFALVVTIRAIVASSRGEYYVYPCSIQFIK